MQFSMRVIECEPLANVIFSIILSSDPTAAAAKAAVTAAKSKGGEKGTARPGTAKGGPKAPNNGLSSPSEKSSGATDGTKTMNSWLDTNLGY